MRPTAQPVQEDSSSGDAVYKNEAPITWLSLPHKTQLFILALCRLSEPLSNTCLLPYIYYLIRSLQPVDTSSPVSISRQAGLLVALFALAQFATSVPWAAVANRWGRKPSIVVGLVLSIIANLGFGFSTTIPALMFWRVLAGVANGNIGVMRTMTAEMVREKKHQSRAFLLLPLVFNTGNVVGLAVGGLLADPVVNLAWLFGPKGVWNIGGDEQGVAWMRAFPFALPTIFNAWVLFCSLCLAVFGLRETMPGWTGREDVGLRAWAAVKRTARRIFQGRAAGYSALETSDSNASELSLLSLPSITSAPETSTRPRPKLSITSRSIYTRRVLTTILSFALFPLHNSAFMNLFPIFLSTPPSPDPPSSPISFTGGLGLPASQIGLYLSTSSIYGILIQMLIYPRIHTRLRTLRTYRLALSLFPLPYLLVPYLALLPPSLHIPSLILLLLLQVSARTFAIPSSIILLTNAAAAPHHLSAIHGVGNMANALARALGPIVGGAAFAWGLEHRLVGFAWWVWVAGISIVGLAWSFVLNEEEDHEAGGLSLSLDTHAVRDINEDVETTANEPTSSQYLAQPVTKHSYSYSYRSGVK